MKINKDLVYLGIIIVLIGICCQFYYDYKYKPNREIQIFYSHEVEADKKIVEEIQNADRFVYFAVYTFTKANIKDALLAAKYRGLEVRGLTDQSQIFKVEAQEKIIKELRDAGIKISTQDHSGIMHLKVLVTDKAYASGSFNWTASATTVNDEVLEIGHDENVRQNYQKLLERMFDKYKLSE